jgi:hypothetical protein
MDILFFAILMNIDIQFLLQTLLIDTQLYLECFTYILYFKKYKF